MNSPPIIPLPDAAPFVALGYATGCLMLRDSDGAVRQIRRCKLDRARIRLLFRDATWVLGAYWPRGSGNGWDSDAVAASMVSACQQAELVGGS